MKMELWTREHGMVYLYPINDVPNLVKLGICSDQRLDVRTTAVCRQIGNLDAVFVAKCEDVKVAEKAMKDHRYACQTFRTRRVGQIPPPPPKIKNGEIDMRIDGITEMRWILLDQFEEMFGDHASSQRGWISNSPQSDSWLIDVSIAGLKVEAWRKRINLPTGQKIDAQKRR